MWPERKPTHSIDSGGKAEKSDVLQARLVTKVLLGASNTGEGACYTA
jgi:hypothetical protein